MGIEPSDVRNTVVFSTVDLIVRKACEAYQESTHHPIDPKAIALIREALMSSIEFVRDAISKPGKINLNYLNKLVVKRVIAVMHAAPGDVKAIKCGVALASLAVVTAEYCGELMVTTLVGSTGVFSPFAAATMVVESLFYLYQVKDLVEEIDNAYNATTETKVPITNYIEFRLPFYVKSFDIRPQIDVHHRDQIESQIDAKYKIKATRALVVSHGHNVNPLIKVPARQLSDSATVNQLPIQEHPLHPKRRKRRPDGHF